MSTRIVCVRKSLPVIGFALLALVATGGELPFIFSYDGVPCRKLDETRRETRGEPPRRVVNIVNFVRALDPRKPKSEYLRALREEVALNLKYGFENTVLLQYDALVDAEMMSEARKSDPVRTEFGLWFEMSRPLNEAAGLEWRPSDKHKSWEWDWFINPGFLMSYDRDGRRKLIDAAFAKFKKEFGTWPKSVGSWLLDAWSMEYMVDTYGVDGFCICREQDSTDAYGLRGGYSNGAYYPSRKNMLSAAVDMKNAVRAPVFKMLTPDPIYNYGLPDRLYPGYPHSGGCPTMEPVWYGGHTSEIVDWYFRVYVEPNGLINLSYMQVGQENSFGWPAISKGLPMQYGKIAVEAAAGHVVVEKMCDTARAFKSAHRENCPQTQIALEDWTGAGRKSVWYNSRFYRANLVMDGNRLFFRDIHKMADDFEEPFLEKACTGWQALYFTPPVVDQWLFRGKDASGTMSLVGEFKSLETESDGDSVLIVTAIRTDGTCVKVRFEEGHIVISGSGFFSEYAADFRKMISVKETGVCFEFEGFRYQVPVHGKVQVTENGFRVDGDKIDLDLSNDEVCHQKLDEARSEARDVSRDEGAYRSVDRVWRSPDGKLALEVEERRYVRFPVVEYIPTLRCVGSEPTGIVSDFRSYAFERPAAGCVVRLLRGTVNTDRDFEPVTVYMGAEAANLPPPCGARNERRTHFATNEWGQTTGQGRSSSDWMPWMGVDFPEGDGLEVAVGWSGAWKADHAFASNRYSLAAGMVDSHFRLYPGEALRQPSTLVFTRPSGVSPRTFQTTIHRFMVNVKSPRDVQGRLIKPILPITAGGGNKTPEAMLRIIDWAKREKMPFDCFWVDAGWNGPPHSPDPIKNCGDMWYLFTGDWRFNPTVHPDGDLGRVADAAHAAGMRMLLWMEPERCVMDPPPPVFKEHRGWLLPRDDVKTEGPRAVTGKRQLCVNFGDPDALAWVLETASELVRRSKLDVFRQDSNFNMLPIWRDNDAPDRRGVTEMKHVMGLWKFWDSLRARFPHLVIENCASGGRRIDYEAVSRSHSYCRTDYAIFHRGPSQITDMQNCLVNILAYLPFQGSETTPANLYDDYGFFSSVSAGSVFTPSDWDAGLVQRPFTAEETAWFKKVFSVADRMRPFFEGDFYPLSDPRAAVPKTAGWYCGDVSERLWCAYQMHRPDLDAGFVAVFRRLDTPSPRFSAALGGIDGTASYEVDVYGGEKRIVSGAELADFSVNILRPRDFHLAFYRKLATSGKHVPLPLPAFSFDYGAAHHVGIPAGWTRHDATVRAEKGRRVEQARARAPDGLELTLDVTHYDDDPVVEWTLSFTNAGTGDSARIRNLSAGDFSLPFRQDETANLWRGIGEMGDWPGLRASMRRNCERLNYSFSYAVLTNGIAESLSCTNGWPSFRGFPYFRVYSPTRGYTVAIGWQGQWSASACRTTDGVRVAAGQETLDLFLKPGETVVSPTITVLAFTDADDGVNAWRRFMRRWILPRAEDGTEPIRPILAFDVPSGRLYETLTATGAVQAIRQARAKGLHMDALWVDAGWYQRKDQRTPDGKPVSWYSGTGTWIPDPARFPQGFKPVAEELAKEGAKLILWYEPERIEKHNDFYPVAKPFLAPCIEPYATMRYDLSRPETVDFLAEMIGKSVVSNGVKFFRQDMNGPAPILYWRAIDAARADGRRGLAENLSVQGEFRFWNELRRRQPGLLFDTCAGGGRRNDLSTLRFPAVPLHYTDTGYTNYVEKLHYHHMLNEWLFYRKNLSWFFHDPKTRHVDRRKAVIDLAQMHTVRSDHYLRPEPWHVQEEDQLIGVWRRTAPLLTDGDYYLLTPATFGEDDWWVTQFHDPRTGSGFLQVVAPIRSSPETCTVKLKGLPAGLPVKFTDLFSNTTFGGVSGTPLNMTKPPQDATVIAYVVCPKHADACQ